MNTQSNEKTSSKQSLIPMLLVAFVAIAAGIFAGSLKLGSDDTTSAGATDSTNDALQAVQNKLVNTAILPDNFKTVPAFTLTKGDNTPLTENNLEGQWSVLFFGFINCPDICPVTLAEMNSAVALLAEENITAPQVLFITVDPKRDTVEKIGKYVDYFNEDFIGATGDLSDITALSRALGIVASYTASKSDPSSYTVDHTASMLLIDPQLKLRAKLNAPHEAATIAADLKTLLATYQ